MRSCIDYKSGRIFESVFLGERTLKCTLFYISGIFAAAGNSELAPCYRRTLLPARRLFTKRFGFGSFVTSDVDFGAATLRRKTVEYVYSLRARSINHHYTRLRVERVTYRRRCSPLFVPFSRPKYLTDEHFTSFTRPRNFLKPRKRDTEYQCICMSVDRADNLRSGDATAESRYVQSEPHIMLPRFSSQYRMSLPNTPIRSCDSNDSSNFTCSRTNRTHLLFLVGRKR